ncbi:MAG: polysaccharide deacetylase family protein [Pirellulales bacterium]|nr:polysaccharide deacetylase family protein [Pirellulales bacterium]
MQLSSLKDPLIGMYYLASLPVRHRLAANRAAAGRAPITVLFYHRVADEHPNDWTISTVRFLAQMAWIRKRFEIIPLVEAQQRMGADSNRTPAVCITFDDGYADNCRTAIPWLLDNQVPFTYFVATQQVLESRPFDHDVKYGAPLAPNSPEELRVMAEAGVELGAHTRTHADLGAIDDEVRLYDEIVGSKRDLELVTGKPVKYFAFPYGLNANLSEAAFRIAFASGYWGVCSAYGDYNVPGDDPFHIHRIHGDPSWPRFCNALTFDPRKFRRVARFKANNYRLSF